MKRVRAERFKRMDRALELVKKAGKPVSIDYVAYHLGVSWHTARTYLFELVAQGKLKAIVTTRGYVFVPGDER
jgi:predicted ArsR family transcriptional regulator